MRKIQMMINRVINKIGKMAPYFISNLFVFIPFKFRHGKVYSEFEAKVKESMNWTEDDVEAYVIFNFNRIFQYAKKFKLYQEKYEKSGVLNLKVKSIEDIRKIPILTRDEIRKHFNEFSGRYHERTGGTTGEPLQIYLDEHAWSREFAHYHTIWGEVGYHYTDAKFVIKKQSINDKFIKFNFQHNEFIVNTYKMGPSEIDKFFTTLRTKNVKFFHGYPSAISDFLKDIAPKISKEQKALLQKQIKCCFFSSEFPLPQIRAYVRDEWGLDFVTFYGHSEVCVLASAPKNQLEYDVFHTYGYTEVEDKMLLGTSYHNHDMPLVRYNTDDLVKPKKYSNGIVKSFEVEQGRIMDIIHDKNDLQIAIHWLIYQKAYKIFDHADYIQAFQEEKGVVTFIISQSKEVQFDALSLMDLENVNFDFKFIYVKEPIRTSSGKVPLRIKELPKNIEIRTK